MNEAAFICAQTGVVPLTFGEPGTGKTRTWEAFCKFIGRDMETVLLSQRDPGEVAGYPCVVDMPKAPTVPNSAMAYTRFDDSKAMEFIKPAWRVRMERSSNGGFVFFDEFGDAPPANQAAALQVMNDGISNTLIVAAGNPPDCSTNAFELAPAMVNRLCVLEWEVDVSSWCTGILDGWASPEFPILPENWQDWLGESRSLISAFIRTRPVLLQNMPQERSERSKPWPSRRSWTNAATLMAACRSVRAGEDVQSKLVAGCVGKAAQEFFVWRRALDLPNPEDVLKNPQMVKQFEDRQDRLWAVLASVVSATIENNTEDRWLAAMDMMTVASKFAVDVVAISIKPLLVEKNKPKSPKCHIPLELVRRIVPASNAK